VKLLQDWDEADFRSHRITVVLVKVRKDRIERFHDHRRSGIMQRNQKCRSQFLHTHAHTQIDTQRGIDVTHIHMKKRN
jgi:hypothetical protein